METRIKFKMFGVTLSGPENLLCDNNGVVKNTIIPESTLSKNHNTINYYYVREASASGIMRIREEYTTTNLANPLTKLIPYYRKQKLLGFLLYGN